jgi:small conductance mechanosensitive channel
MDQFLSNAIQLITTYGGKIIAAILVFIIGSIVIRGLNRLIGNLIEKSKLDGTIKNVLKNLVKYLLYIILILACVEILGVPMSSVIAVLASCGLAIGLALQGALTNFAGGVMILIFHPYKVGDYIEASGAEGTVSEISLFYTTIMTIDNKKIMVPNGDIMGANITNFTAMEKRRVDMEFRVTNDIDVNLVKEVLLKSSSETKGVLDDPEPFVRMTSLGDDAYVFTVRAWCNTADYWDVYFDILENGCRALGENGIDDPESRMAVRLVNEE